jgi:hypothetical protein
LLAELGQWDQVKTKVLSNSMLKDAYYLDHAASPSRHKQRDPTARDRRTRREGL